MKQYAKAIYAGAVAALGGLGAVLVGNTSFADVTAGQWVWIASLTLIASGGVAGITNASPPPKP